MNARTAKLAESSAALNALTAELVKHQAVYDGQKKMYGAENKRLRKDMREFTKLKEQIEMHDSGGHLEQPPKSPRTDDRAFRTKSKRSFSEKKEEVKAVHAPPKVVVMRRSLYRYELPVVNPERATVISEIDDEAVPIIRGIANLAARDTPKAARVPPIVLCGVSDKQFADIRISLDSG